MDSFDPTTAAAEHSPDRDRPAARWLQGTDLAPMVRSKRVAWALNGAILVLAGLVVWAELGPGSGITGGGGAGVLLLTAVYAAIGVLGIPSLSSRSSTARTGIYFGAQLALVAGLSALGKTPSSVDLLFPLVAQAAFHLRSRRALLIVSLGIVGVILVTIALHPVSIGDTAAFLVGCGFIATMARLMVAHARERLRAEATAAELHTANVRLSALMTEAEIAAASRERVRIARDIHDSLGHCLTSAHVHLQAVERMVEPDHAAAPAIAESRRLTRQALVELRQAVATLREPELPLRPLAEAIESLVKAAPAAFRFEVRGEPRALSPRCRYVLFRTTQEALSNVIRHADAKHASVTLRFDQEDQVVLEVTDDGRGAAPARGGFGLIGIEERVREVGGCVDVMSELGRGFCLRVEVPA